MNLNLRVVLLTACVLMPEAARAQGLSGALIGTVKDEQGGVLQGAVVRVTSSALIGGELTVTTNGRGQWRFPVLPPGIYTVEIQLAHREELVDNSSTPDTFH